MKLLFAFLAFSVFVLMPDNAWAAYNDVVLGGGNVVTIGTTNANVLVNSGDANIEYLRVDGSNIAAELQSGSALTLSNSDKKVLASGEGSALVTNLCTATSSTLGFVATASTSVSITPSSSTCSGLATAAGGGSGGGGGSSGGSSGGGGGGVITTTTTSASTTTTATTTTTTSTKLLNPSITPGATNLANVPPPLTGRTPSGVTLPIASTHSALFTAQLRLGMKNADVRRLQELLASDASLYPEGTASGYYGPLTKKAVGRFQEKYDLANTGDAGYGEVGPKTRAKLAEVFGSGASSIPAITTPPTTGGASALFSRAMTMGTRGEDVKRLQQLLNSDPATLITASGAGSPGNESDYFGAKTRAAVAAFQMKHGLVQSESDAGYGFVGPKTRAKFAEVFANGGVSSGVSASTSLPSTFGRGAGTTGASTAAQIQQQIDALLQQVQMLTQQVSNAQGSQ